MSQFAGKKGKLPVKVQFQQFWKAHFWQTSPTYPAKFWKNGWLNKEMKFVDKSDHNVVIHCSTVLLFIDIISAFSQDINTQHINK